jgi:Fe2+ transport system protein FeoA
VTCTFQSLETLKEKRSSKLRKGKEAVPLSGLAPGQKGLVVRLKARGTIRERLTQMDLVPGSILEVEEAGEDGSGVRVKGYHRTLRSDDADRVLVEVL